MAGCERTAGMMTRRGVDDVRLKMNGKADEYPCAGGEKDAEKNSSSRAWLVTYDVLFCLRAGHDFCKDELTIQ